MKLLLVDDHPLVERGLRAVLEHEPDFELAGYATSGQEAMGLFSRINPDMVLLDLRLPGESGLEVMRQIRALRADAKCVILTSFSTLAEVRVALEQGADGYVLKDALPQELLQALKLVASGRKYYDPKAMETMVKAHGDEVLSSLSEREIEVLKELAAGRSNKQIGERLFIAENTVKKHVSSILVKLGLEDRTQAALLAVKEGLVT
jgi:two-component system, NarL family, nitrate/nitrite response regulator NarL